eukprot:566058-Amphidinium_carterae.1
MSTKGGRPDRWGKQQEKQPQQKHKCQVRWRTLGVIEHGAVQPPAMWTCWDQITQAVRLFKVLVQPKLRQRPEY